jgi:hypothetical protein
MSGARLSPWLIALLAVPAGAQVPPDGAPFQVNTFTTERQYHEAVAADASGNFVVVWRSVIQDGGLFGGIFGQRFDSAGQRRGAEFQVNEFTSGTQEAPAVASDAAGNFIVAWASPQDGSQRGVYARRYDSSGAPVGSEFRVNTYTTSDQSGPRVASDASGNVLIAWTSNGQDGSGTGAYGQLFAASGAPTGAEFRINSNTAGSQGTGTVAADAGGRFTVIFRHQGLTGGFDVFGRRYDASGTPISGEFKVNMTMASGPGSGVASDAGGNFVVVWTSSAAAGGQGFDVTGRLFDSTGAPRGPEFLINTYTTRHQFDPIVVSDPAGNFVVAWEDGYQAGGYKLFAQAFQASGQPRGHEFALNDQFASQRQPQATALGAGHFVVVWATFGVLDADVFAQRFAAAVLPAGLDVDTAASSDSDGNHMLEPGETADVRPSWRNFTGASQTFDGTVLTFTGPPAPSVTYDLPDDVATYGTVADGDTITCSECYAVHVGFGGTRPATHWDTVLTEQLTPGQTKPWSVHVGRSFADVPSASVYYRDVETLLHNGVTGGCTSASYCPSGAVTREQMAVFALRGKKGAAYTPPFCGPVPMFADVPPLSFFCAWIEELARRGVVSGCGGGNYCPTGVVTREQMPVFVLRLLDPALNPPGCTVPVFADVPATSPFCRWIEELARRGVVTGCGNGNYCPTAPVTREQMAVFITATYGLTLYGP